MLKFIALPHAQPTCLTCKQRTALHMLCFLLQEGYPHDHPAHQITHTYATLMYCNACHSAQLEYGSHDCWNHYEDEPWDMYWWYLLTAPDTQHIRRLLQTCPRPLDPHCPCPTHTHLRHSITHLKHPLHACTTLPAGGEAASRIILHLTHGIPQLVLPA